MLSFFSPACFQPWLTPDLHGLAGQPAVLLCSCSAWSITEVRLPLDAGAQQGVSLRLWKYLGSGAWYLSCASREGGKTKEEKYEPQFSELFSGTDLSRQCFTTETQLILYVLEKMLPPVPILWRVGKEVLWELWEEFELSYSVIQIKTRAWPWWCFNDMQHC